MPYGYLDTMMFDLPASPRRSFGVISSVSLLGFVLAGVNCSSKGGGGATGASCATDQTVCSSGETCWPTSATTIACITSLKSAALGAACVEEYNHATCGDGMLCDATDPSGNGHCAQYCSPSAPSAQCPTGYSCEVTQLGSSGPTVELCRVTPPPPPSDDGGADAGSYDEGGELPDISFIPDVGLDTGPARQ
jgi:hypothetical protein